MLETIILPGKRVATIVDNMPSFAHKADSSISSHCLNAILDKTLELASTDYDLKQKFDFKSINIIK